MNPKPFLAFATIVAAGAAFSSATILQRARELSDSEAAQVVGGAWCYVDDTANCAIHYPCQNTQCTLGVGAWVCPIPSAKTNQRYSYPDARQVPEGYASSQKEEFVGEGFYCWNTETCTGCKNVSGIQRCVTTGPGPADGFMNETFASGDSCATHGP